MNKYALEESDKSIQVLTMDALEKFLVASYANQESFVAISVHMDGFPENEVIINPSANIISKLEYYRKTYDFNLNHKFADGIRITGYSSSCMYDEIQADLVD